jgi:hypothetical protein
VIHFRIAFILFDAIIYLFTNKRIACTKSVKQFEFASETRTFLGIATEIKKKDKNVKACFVTARELYYESLKKEFPKIDVGCFIRKPIDIDDLVSRIEKELCD